MQISSREARRRWCAPRWRRLFLERFEPRIVLTPVAQLLDLNGVWSDSSPGQIISAGNGTAYFPTYEYPYGLWKTDGTAVGTVRIPEFNSDSSGAFQAINGTLFFAHNDRVNGWELWKTDGTAAGTKLLKDIYPGPGDSKPNSLTNVNGTLMFMAMDYGGFQLWKSDGTSEGTVNVTGQRVVFGSTDEGHYLTNVNGTVFFHPDTRSNSGE